MNTEDLLEKKKPKSAPLLLSTRLAIVLAGFFGFVMVYSLKVIMSVAMVCMVNHTALDGMGNGTNENSTSQQQDGEFVWTKPIQGIILGSFFWGYLITEIPGGFLSHKFGGKHVFGWCMFICALASLLIPVGARLHYGVLLALRFIIGLVQGTVWPAMHCILARWVPPLERSRLIGWTFAGSQIGNVVAMPVSGVLCTYGFAGGWPSIFYVFGCATLVWFIGWMVVVYDSPDKHPRISKEEKNYIDGTLTGAVSEKPLGVPWLAIFTSWPVWGLIVVHTCSNWGIYTFLTQIPTFLKDVFHFKISVNGGVSALPYIGFYLAIIMSSSIADLLLQKKLVSITACRKIFNGIGMFGPAVFILILGHIPSHYPTLAVAFLVIGVALSGCPYGAGYIVNAADIAPNYSGILFSISNTFATIPGFIAPLVAGYLTKDKSQAAWQIVFYICSIIFVVGGIFYSVTGSGILQKWATMEEKHATFNLDDVPKETAELLGENRNKDSKAQDC